MAKTKIVVPVQQRIAVNVTFSADLLNQVEVLDENGEIVTGTVHDDDYYAIWNNKDPGEVSYPAKFWYSDLNQTTNNVIYYIHAKYKNTLRNDPNESSFDWNESAETVLSESSHKRSIGYEDADGGGGNDFNDAIALVSWLTATDNLKEFDSDDEPATYGEKENS